MSEGVPPADSPELTEQCERFVKFLCRHVVCMGITYIALDELGNDVGPQRTLFCTCFVVQFRGLWLLLTAGHILKEELDENVEARRMRIVSSCLGDHFGPDAKVKLPVSFDYEATPRFYVDDRELGLDLGIIGLRPYFQQHLAANGVAPVTEENWLQQHQVQFDSFGLLGFPAATIRVAPHVGEFGEEEAGVVPAYLIVVEKLDSLPEGMQKSRLPFFVGRIHAQLPFEDIKGMSGGPIIGFRFAPQFQYWIVALQSRWHKPSRTILACPVPVFMDVLDREFQVLVNDNQTEPGESRS
jgi:hypothetical protein